MRVPSRKRLLFLLAPMILAAGCARSPVDVPEIVKPYRITIQQGNYVTREMVQQLKPGMTREQVRYVLGTPLLTDIFHADRWDYVFYRDAPGGKREQRNISVMFEDGKLTRVLGDLLPSDPVQEAPKPVAKPEPKPEPKPEVAKPVAEAAKPVAAAEPKAESGAEAKPEEKPEEKPARGFFGRMLEKIGL
jgi:outer membrane protein assembly factor BamE